MVLSALEHVKAYYGTVLGGKKDLKTSACCSAEAMPPYLRTLLDDIDDEILDKFYGCGSPIPPVLEGRVVVDLGCGTGRDVYLMSRLVGPEGFVIGVDMTAEQLAVAQRHRAGQAARFGFETPNVEFRLGYIEDLQTAGLGDNSVDVVISNCVINLSPDKRAVFSEIFRVLKPGGELYFSDIFADRRIPAHLAADPVLRGECLGGALYIEDFRRILRTVGRLDYRVVAESSVTVDDPELERRVGPIGFTSKTIRAFKLGDLIEDLCEDYGQVAIYQGTVPEMPHRFLLDDHHRFETGKPMLVCGNTAAMLQHTRFREHVKVIGDRSVHYGAFDCRPASRTDPESGGCC